jgi:hypothetical protein
MTSLLDASARQRAHTERMLARAERRSKQAAKLVEKWKARLTELDREGVAAKQARLWSDDHPAQQSDTNQEQEPTGFSLPAST